MAKTYSAVVTAQAANVAFQIEVSTVGTIVLERSITFAPAGFVYQSKTSYNGSTVITAGAGVDKPVLTVGGGLIDTRTGAVSERFKGGYKSFVLFNRTLTTEELAYVERWMA